MARVEGEDKVLRNLKRAIEAIIKGASQGARLWTEVVVTEGKRTSPVKFGNLRGSGRGHGPEDRGREILVAASFGSGVSASYAVPVHVRFKPWFKDAINKEQNKALPLMERMAKRKLKGAVKS